MVLLYYDHYMAEGGLASGILHGIGGRGTGTAPAARQLEYGESGNHEQSKEGPG